MRKSQVRSLVLSELLSGSKAAKELQSKHKDATVKALKAVQLVQDFLGKDCISDTVVDKFNTLSESDFVKFIDSQLADSQKGKIDGSNLFRFMVTVAKKTKLK